MRMTSQITINNGETRLIDAIEWHQNWLKSDRQYDYVDKECQRLVLADENLIEIEFECEDLSFASFIRCDLTGSSFDNAVLIGCAFYDSTVKDVSFYGANLKGSHLQGADFTGADLDFSCLPFSCGGLRWKIDKKLFCQMVYHVASMELDADNPVNADCIALQKQMYKLANQFERVEECGYLGLFEEEDIPNYHIGVDWAREEKNCKGGD